MSGADDPYLLPNGTLRNKLGIADASRLGAAEGDLVAVRERLLRDRLPGPPFTFGTLKAVHHDLFQDVYAWAGQARTSPLAKREYDHPASPVQAFANPDVIASRAEAVFKRLAEQDGLAGTSRAAFAAGATETFVGLNALHFARDGNGRSQRLLLAAIARSAGHTLAFDAVTRERMVAVSVAAHKGDSSGVRRMFDEILDPRQVEAMRKALGFLQASGAVRWNDLYIATTRAGQTYDGTLAGRAGTDFMLRASAQAGAPRILIGDAADLPPAAASGDRVRLTASQFAPPTEGSPQPKRVAPAPILSSILNAVRPPEPSPASDDPASAALIERLRAFEARLSARAAPAATPQEAADPDPDETPRPGPKP